MLQDWVVMRNIHDDKNFPFFKKCSYQKIKLGLQYIGITYASEYKPKLTFAKLMLIMLVIV